MASVIIVDDEEMTRDMLVSVLKKEGYTVLAVAGVSEAQTLLCSQKIDVLISDIYLQGSSGIDLLNWTQKKFPYLPVILLTGNHTTDTAADAIRQGAFAYLTKPVEMSELLDLTSRAAQLSQYFVPDNACS